MVSKLFKKLYLGLIFVFLYAPIVVMIVLSFNEGRSPAVWEGFSFKWYLELFDDRNIMEALKVTISVAVIATIVSTILGTLAAVGIHAMKKGWANAVLNVSYLPMTMPDIVTGVSLMLLFIQLNIPTGFWTMLLAHIAFDTPYVLFSVMPKLQHMNPNMYEAALDLGCKPAKAIWKVIIPEISPGIVTGMLMAFTMSIDDFIISYFTGGTVNNLSMAVYGSAKRGVSPSMYALFAIMFVVILTLLIIVNSRSSGDERD